MIRYISVNHRGSSLEEREGYLRSVRETNEPHVELSTCNRLERYWGEGAVEEPVARHLFRVASGLESAITGEWAVLGQVKEAYRAACERHRLSPSMHRLFQWAIHAGKRARLESGISRGAASHGQAAAAIIAERHPDLTNKTVAVIGVNKLVEETIKFLRRKGAATFILSNRNLSKAEEMAARLGCSAVALGERRQLLAAADVAICATSAHHPIVCAEDMTAGRPVTVVDLSFPRNVAPEAGLLPEVELFDLEYVEEFVRQRLAMREECVAPAERIVEEEVERLMKWYDNYLKYTGHETNGVGAGL